MLFFACTGYTARTMSMTCLILIAVSSLFISALAFITFAASLACLYLNILTFVCRRRVICLVLIKFAKSCLFLGLYFMQTHLLNIASRCCSLIPFIKNSSLFLNSTTSFPSFTLLSSYNLHCSA